MLRNSIELQKIIGTVSDWARELKSEKLCSEIYLFGSLVNQDGRYFIISGAVKSDIDILITFPDEVANATMRCEVASVILGKLGQLEKDVAELIPRKDVKATEGLMSVLLIPYYDIYHSVHKGYDPKIFSQEIFIDLLSEDLEKFVCLSNFIDDKYHMENIEYFAVARMAQKIRNNYLKTNFFGDHFAEDEDDPYDSLPKEILRIAALINFVLSGSDNISRNEAIRTNLTDGEKFIFDTVQSKISENSMYEELYKKLTARRSNRAESPKLSPADVLFTIEIMYDIMRCEIKPSIRETLDTLIENGALKGEGAIDGK